MFISLVNDSLDGTYGVYIFDHAPSDVRMIDMISLVYNKSNV